ncbi:ComF family protein, partial [Telluria sp. Tellsp104]
PWCARQIRDAVLARPGPSGTGHSRSGSGRPGRLVERGFNQALEIARPLAAALGATPDCAGVSSVRAQNVRGAFAVEAPDLV